MDPCIGAWVWPGAGTGMEISVVAMSRGVVERCGGGRNTCKGESEWRWKTKTGISGKESRGAGGGCRSPQQRTRSVASEDRCRRPPFWGVGLKVVGLYLTQPRPRFCTVVRVRANKKPLMCGLGVPVGCRMKHAKGMLSDVALGQRYCLRGSAFREAFAQFAGF